MEDSRQRSSSSAVRDREFYEPLDFLLGSEFVWSTERASWRLEITRTRGKNRSTHFYNPQGRDIDLRRNGEDLRLPLASFFLLLELPAQVVSMISSFQKGRGLTRCAAPGGLMRLAASNRCRECDSFL